MLFRLTIELGNDLMRKPSHIAKALRDVATTLADRVGMGQRIGAFGSNTAGRIIDPNGNSVGTWEVTDADEQEYKSPDWILRLQDNYDNDLEQWESFDRCYNLSTRLGFRSTQEAWDANPWIGGTTDPGDFRVICK